jgi:predicted NBD/HSP70 family sugar kinase
MTRDLLAGIDVGGSKIAVIVADRDLHPVARHTIQTGVGDAAYAVSRIGEAMEATLALAGRSPADLLAIGVGVPGRVDPTAGSVTLAVNLGWHDLPLGPRLAERYGVPVGVENDVRAAAAGLHARRVVGDSEDLAYLSIGTGISAGVILDGRLHRGPRGLAGEIGHVVLEPGGPPCMCGLRGCFEALASGRAVGAIAEAALDAGTASSLGAFRPVTAVDVYREAAAGDPLAAGIASVAGRYVARAVHELVMAYDVRRVVLGGGVTTAGRTFLDPVERGLDDLRSASELAREALPSDVVHLLPPGADAGGWGGVILARSAARFPGATAAAGAGEAAEVATG